MPALRRLIYSTRRDTRGTAKLEFAMTVIVFSVIGAFGLEHIAQLKKLAGVAQVQTTAAQQRSLVALNEARCAGAAGSPAVPNTARSASATPFTTHRATPLNPLQPGPPEFPCSAVALPSPPLSAPPFKGIAP